MTKRMALQTTAELWSWLAQHPGKVKAEWPGWTEENFSLARCPCCECAAKILGRPPRCFVVNAETRKDLEACPMGPVFPKGCKDYASPYLRWDISVSVVREAGKNMTTIEKEFSADVEKNATLLANAAKTILERE